MHHRIETLPYAISARFELYTPTLYVNMTAGTRDILVLRGSRECALYLSEFYQLITVHMKRYLLRWRLGGTLLDPLR